MADFLSSGEISFIERRLQGKQKLIEPEGGLVEASRGFGFSLCVLTRTGVKWGAKGCISA